MSAPGVVYSVQAPEQRNRLTVFFRLILLIPQLVMLLVVELLAFICVFISWWALLFTGRYPDGLYNFVAGVQQYVARVNAYCYLQVDQYPPFSLGEAGDYPASLSIPPAKEQYSRVKVLFRIILAIPVLILVYAFQIVAEVMAIVVWLVCLVAGKTPEGLHSPLNLGVSYMVRANPYLGLLIEDWPEITQESGLTVGAGAPPSLDSAPEAPVPPQTVPAAEPEAPVTPGFEPPTPPPPPPPPPAEEPPGPFGPSDGS